jgi:glycosyltransferase involved in cell wall biosynthesis
MASLEQLPAPPPGKTGWPWTEATPPLPAEPAYGVPWPRITVVTPSFNQGKFIEKTLRSVLLQGYPNLEYIVMDGGSQDNSVEIIQKYAPWLTHWESQPDRGQTHALNKGFERSTGALLAWLNSDDIYLPAALGTVAKASIHAAPDVGAFVGIGHFVDEHDHLKFAAVPREPNLQGFLRWLDYGYISQAATLFTREAWEQCRPLDEKLYFVMDVDLWLRIAQHFRFQPVEAVLARATEHDSAKTIAQRDRMIVELSLQLVKYGGEEIARHNLMRMADELTGTRRRLTRLVNHPLFRIGQPLSGQARRVMGYLRRR